MGHARGLDYGSFGAHRHAVLNLDDDTIAASWPANLLLGLRSRARVLVLFALLLQMPLLVLFLS